MDFAQRVQRRNAFDASLVYGTKKFNFLTGRDKHVTHRKNTDDQWNNPQTGYIYEKFSEKRNCPLCGSSKNKEMFVKAGFPHVKCDDCSLVYVNLILNEAEYKKLWSAEDSWEEILENEHQVKMQTLEAAYSLDVAEQYLAQCDERISVCDIGCGPATLLSEAQKRGYDVFGIEPNQRCRKFLEQKKIDHIIDFFPLKQSLKKQFDLVFFLNTLEHLREPLKIVLEIKKQIKTDGLLYISVPNMDALVNRIMHERAGVFGGHSHIQFFNHKTLTVLLEKAGFEVLEYETIITELGVIKNYLSYEDPYFGDGDVNYDFLTPENIYRNHLARNVNIVALKKK